jgi:hypothetical protein
MNVHEASIYQAKMMQGASCAEHHRVLDLLFLCDRWTREHPGQFLSTELCMNGAKWFMRKPS